MRQSIISIFISIFLLGLFSNCEKEGCITMIPEYCHLMDIDSRYDPVCGCDGKTYYNAGHAICVGGITEYTKGECK